MEVVYQSNLRCGSCLSKLKPYLDAEPTIQQWSSDLADPRKLVRVQLNSIAEKSRVLELFQQAGFSAQEIITEKAVAKEASKFQLSTYRPLLLVVAYILGVTLFTEFAIGQFAWTRAMNHFMGFFFVGFAFFKLLNVTAFAEAFQTYDVVAKRWYGYALAYPFVELGLGIMYLSQVLPLLANGVTIAVMGIGLVGVIAAVRTRKPIQCACLGTVFNLPMSVVTIVENSAMLLMAAIMLILATSPI